MRPTEKFAKVMRVLRFCVKICGADVFDKNYKINVVTYFGMFCILIYFVFSAYTFHLKFSEDWTIALESFCIVGSVLQGCVKYCSALFYAKFYYSQYMFLRRIYEQYDGKNDEYTCALDKCITRLRFAFQVTGISFFVTVFIWISVPIVIWVVTGRRFFVIQFYLPFLDTDTYFGYFASIAVQSTCVFVGAFGNFSADSIMLIYFGHSTLLVDIFALKAKELNELAADFDSKKVWDKLEEIILWHQTYSDFIETTDIMYFWVTFTQITTSALSIVLTLVIMFTGFWPGSYVYIMVSFILLYLYCIMGTLVESANERLMEEIYAIHWYLFIVPQQKAIRFMLMKAQSAKQISVGGVVPLSVSTGLQVTKSVYSVFMMLLNFLE